MTTTSREDAIERAKLIVGFLQNRIAEWIGNGSIAEMPVTVKDWRDLQDVFDALVLASPSPSPEGWRPIAEAPKMRTLLLFAETSTDPPNWKMATGFYHTGYETSHDGTTSPWNWEGRQLQSYETKPTYFMELPAAPAKEGRAG